MASILERAMAAQGHHGCTTGADEDRKWLGPQTILPYESESNAVAFYALEGSPPHGFILLWCGKAVRLDSDGTMIGIFTEHSNIYPAYIVPEEIEKEVEEED